MIKVRNFIAVLGIAVTVVSAPALAQNPAGQAGYSARAQAIESGISQDGVPLERARALRECNDTSSAFRNYTWGHTQGDLYRSCMAQHGQPE